MSEQTPQQPDEPVQPGPGRKSTPSPLGPWENNDPYIAVILDRITVSTLAARLGCHRAEMLELIKKITTRQRGGRVLTLSSQRHWQLLDEQLKRELMQMRQERYGGSD